MPIKMLHPILILTHNNMALTHRCLKSVFAQDIPTRLLVVDNGSTDETVKMLDAMNIVPVIIYGENLGVSHGWNDGLSVLFARGYEHCLCVGNDTVIPPWFYSDLLSYNLPFVTGVATDNMAGIAERGQPNGLQAHPDFSAFCIRRECWDKVGKFDERMKLYASDTDYHVRAHRAGVPLWKANVAYYHERSSTLRLAPEAERLLIQEQANKDRAVFKEIYGCVPGTPEYSALFT